ncbi:hypothetical protein [Carboxylicivirga marina]|uniref:Biopterin-dependent aromatic amino acid hydroxylase family profile domain-containing protein n=1 Tax=Carboxylicivirga marina TaxID=2800988 RepID=A0ABS1HN71_9BACT|nr:hypothetical protein [Carboxylicivirga marina]MBK3518992.1 hypothetical protein [Carboxylicivirga marina]
MSNTSTHDYLAEEEDANYWLSVFEKMPDALFADSKVMPRAFILTKIKAFARAYEPVVVLGKESEVIMN